MPFFDREKITGGFFSSEMVEVYYRKEQRQDDITDELVDEKDK